MSTTEEKYRALISTYALCEELAFGKEKMKLEELREWAKRVLRHWPHAREIKITWDKR